MPLDSRVKHENDNKGILLLDTQIKSGMTRKSISQSGRSMVEMLGVLAIVGVLSIGGIMGYSYGMDKYRANQTMQDVNLRGIDVLAQFDRTGDANLNEWQNEKTIYPITLEDETIGIQVDKVPERVCNMLAEGMAHVATGIKVNGTYVTEDDNTCDGDENTLVFYFDEESVANAPVQCPSDPTSNMINFINCDGENGPTICVMGNCYPDATTLCVEDAECPYDRGCAVNMEDSILSAPGANCKKDGTDGKCDPNGKCRTNSEPVICGGINCAEKSQKLYEQIIETYPGYITLSSIPNECFMCLDDRCVSGECFVNNKIVLCDADAGLCFNTCQQNTDCFCGKCMPFLEDFGVCAPYDNAGATATGFCSINGQDGMCMNGECYPTSTQCENIVCPQDEGCGFCYEGKCENVINSFNCTKNGKNGMCNNGECVVGACIYDSDCSANQFCGGPNTSDEERYPDGIGDCKPVVKYYDITFEGKTYYISENAVSGWDLDVNNCSTIDKENIDISEIIVNYDKYPHADEAVFTDLGKKILEYVPTMLFSRDSFYEPDPSMVIGAGNYIDEFPSTEVHIICK